MVPARRARRAEPVRMGYVDVLSYDVELKVGRQPRQQSRRRGAEAAEAREEIPHVSKRTTNRIDSNVEILFMALVKVIEDMKRNARDDAERFTENGKVGSRRRANHGFRARARQKHWEWF